MWKLTKQYFIDVWTYLWSKTTVDDIPLDDAPAHYEYLSNECIRKIQIGGFPMDNDIERISLDFSITRTSD